MYDDISGMDIIRGALLRLSYTRSDSSFTETIEGYSKFSEGKWETQMVEGLIIFLGSLCFG